MRLISFETKAIHNQFKNIKISFSPKEGFSEVYESYYPLSNYSLFIGENGSGKTTLLSSVAKFFYYLENQHERIRSGTQIEYTKTIKDESIHFKLKRVKEGIEIERNGKFLYMLQEQPTYNMSYQTIGYEEFRPHLPKLILSAFSIHGEYPMDDEGTNASYVYHDISTIYRNLSNPESLVRTSPRLRGLKKLVNLLHSRKHTKLEKFLQMMGLTYANEILIRADYEDQNLNVGLFKWTWVNKKYLDSGYHIADIMFKRGGKEITLQSMSSGERMLWERMLSILADIDHNTVVLIEEPELHLNPTWIKQFITFLDLLFGEYQAHFIIATHSFAIIHQLFPENIHVINKGEVYHPNFPTFMANEIEIKHNLFPNYQKANDLERDVSNRIERATNAEELRTMLDYLGDSYAKFQVYKRLQKFEGGQ